VATPAGVALPGELVDELELLLLLEPHPATATDAAMSAAQGASQSLIAHASKALRSTTVA
jgi:hypothetical protein